MKSLSLADLFSCNVSCKIIFYVLCVCFVSHSHVFVWFWWPRVYNLNFAL